MASAEGHVVWVRLVDPQGPERSASSLRSSLVMLRRGFSVFAQEQQTLARCATKKPAGHHRELI